MAEGLEAKPAFPPPESPKAEGHAFFDPRMPPLVPEVFGLPTPALIDLAKSAGSIAALTPYSRKTYKYTSVAFEASSNTENAIRVMPLITRVQSGEEITPEEVRIYRKPLKRLVPKLATADRWARFGVVLGGVGIPARRKINSKIEEELPKRLPSLLDEASVRVSEYLPMAEPYVTFFEDFDNPRQQFVSEVKLLSDSIRGIAYGRAESRGAGKNVTSEDATDGIRETINGIFTHRQAWRERMPMLSGLVIEKLPLDSKGKANKALSNSNFGVVAPEIIAAIENVLPKDERDDWFYNSILRHPHPRRGLAEKFKSTEMDGVKRLSKQLLPSIRKLLPTRGTEVRQIFDDIKQFLGV
jgi:hypothetical protein